MFLSKIWFFLIAVIAAVALAVALVMPRPAQRVQADEVEPQRLGMARSGVEFLLRSDARSWIDAAAVAARAPGVGGGPSLPKILEATSSADSVTAQAHEQARGVLGALLVASKQAQDGGGSAQVPEFAIALDDGGRVVARVGIDEQTWGDEISGYYLVRDALRGYQRDDLWTLDGKLFRVAASPVFTTGSDGRPRYVGAVVLGDEMNLDLVRALEERVQTCRKTATGEDCQPKLAFFIGEETAAASDNVLVGKDVVEGWRKAKAAAGEGKPGAPFTIKAGGKDVLVAVKPLPGEVGEQEGFFAVYAPRSAAVGFSATLSGVRKEDTDFGHFPWIPLIAGFLVVTLGGLALMWVEADRPLRRLMVDAVALGKGDAPKLNEERHKGRFGSIARSVNIALEKLAREARERRKDLGAVLGPAPDEGMGSGGGGGGGLGLGLGGPAPFAQPAPVPAFRFETEAPTPPPMHLPPPGAPPGRANVGAAPMPAGLGFDFDASPPPPLAPPEPPARPAPGPKPPIPSAKPPIPSAAKPPIPSAAGKTPPPKMTRGLAAAPPPPMIASLDDDILSGGIDELEPDPAPAQDDFGGGRTVVAGPSDDLIRQSADGDAAYFREVYDDFVELKQKCGESVEGLTYDKFAAKLRGNREQLIKKYGCKSVQFQVYVKDGKAALKATPVK